MYILKLIYTDNYLLQILFPPQAMPKRETIKVTISQN